MPRLPALAAVLLAIPLAALAEDAGLTLKLERHLRPPAPKPDRDADAFSNNHAFANHYT